MAKTDIITRDLLLELLEYDATTGDLVWKKRSPHFFKEGAQSAEHNAAIWNGRYAGRSACSIAVTGYKETSVLAIRCTAHRIIWMMVHGKWPNNIDHINGDRTDNRLANLREVTVEENNKNLMKRATNKSGVTGVFWVESHQKWRACIGAKVIGNFHVKEDAVAARKKAEADNGYHPNHGRH